jgi:hypothetical protein
MSQNTGAMSRNTVILLLVLCVGVAVMIGVSSKKRTVQDPPSQQVSQNTDTQPSPRPPGTGAQPGPGTPGANSSVAVTPAPTTTPATSPGNAAPGVGRTAVAAANPPGTVAQPRPGVQLPPINRADTNELPIVKPLPVLEKDYASATNRDTRLDIMMDIAETPGADAVRALTRLFEIENDTDLKIDLLDSLLGIDGFKEEKLIMLTLGARQGLSSEIRQSAIDGLIDLDDARVIPVLNGLLNDPDEEIREGAQDALEMIQSAQNQPAVRLVNPGAGKGK